MTVVLIVEDEPLTLAHLSEFLAEEGFQVLTVSDGYAAVGMLGREAVDVVLADVGLPGTLGTSIVTHALKKTPAPAVILMSGYSYGIPELVKSQGVPVLQKPVELDVVARTIREQLAARDRLEALAAAPNSAVPTSIPNSTASEMAAS